MRTLLAVFVCASVGALLSGCCGNRCGCPCPCGPGLVAGVGTRRTGPDLTGVGDRLPASAPAQDTRCAGLSHDVPYKLGETYLKDGDRIEIQGLKGDRASLEEGGTYCVWGKVTRRAEAPEAALMVWNADGESAVEVPREAAAGPGTRPYRFRFRMVKLGAPHLSMYPLGGGTSVASLYFHPAP